MRRFFSTSPDRSHKDHSTLSPSHNAEPSTVHRAPRWHTAPTSSPAALPCTAQRAPDPQPASVPACDDKSAPNTDCSHSTIADRKIPSPPAPSAHPAPAPPSFPSPANDPEFPASAHSVPPSTSSSPPSPPPSHPPPTTDTYR